MYDSTDDTLEHIDHVRSNLFQVVSDLVERAEKHDQSKLVSPEKEVFDKYTPKLEDCTYDSDEYKGYLKSMGATLEHHYAHNDHHPEHFKRGIEEMNLMQIIEMLADWKAATLRHKDGDLFASIEANSIRFGFGEEMTRLLVNTAHDLGWIAGE